MMIIESKYELGQMVFLKTDDEQKKRMVKQICLSCRGIEYNLICGTVNSWHSDFEINDEVDILIKTGVEKES